MEVGPQVKDRHDGNILLQRDGGIVHVDYGYMMGKYMNGVVEVERAPFKLTRDHVEVGNFFDDDDGGGGGGEIPL